MESGPSRREASNLTAQGRMNRLYSPSILVVLALAMPACSSVPTEASPEGRAELAGQLFDSSDQLSLDEELMMIADSIPNFGGLWIDSAQAYVAIVGETSESETAVSINRIRDIVVRSRGELSFARGLPIAVRSVRYSFRELHTWWQAYDDSPTQQSVVFSDTDERHNTVTVGVAKGASISQVEPLENTWCPYRCCAHL